MVNAVLLMLACTLFTSVGQALFKLSASQDLLVMITNPLLYAGLLSYGIGAAILVLALRSEELSKAYPMVSLSFIWVLVISVVVFGEMLTPGKIAGMIAILSGVVVLGR